MGHRLILWNRLRTRNSKASFLQIFSIIFWTLYYRDDKIFLNEWHVKILYFELYQYFHSMHTTFCINNSETKLIKPNAKKEKSSLPKRYFGMAHISNRSFLVESSKQWYLYWMSPSEFPHALEHFSDASFSYSLVFLRHSDTLFTVPVQTLLVTSFYIQ